MRKYLFGIAFATLALLTACVKDINVETEIIGKVVEKSTQQPVNGVAVTITDGTQNYASAITGRDGTFSLKDITFDALSKKCYLYANGSSINLPSRKVTLPGSIIGNRKYDLKNIDLYDIREFVQYNNLPTFTYSGKTYKVAPPSPSSYRWSDANEYCNNLTLYFADWRMPSMTELESMTGIPDIGGAAYWSSTGGGFYGAHYIVTFYTDGTTDANYYTYGDADYRSHVRPVRVVN